MSEWIEPLLKNLTDDELVELRAALDAEMSHRERWRMRPRSLGAADALWLNHDSVFPAASFYILHHGNIVSRAAGPETALFARFGVPSASAI